MKKQEFRGLMKKANRRYATVSLRIDEPNGKAHYFNEGWAYSPHINNGRGVCRDFESAATYLWRKIRKVGGFTDTKSGIYYSI